MARSPKGPGPQEPVAPVGQFLRKEDTASGTRITLRLSNPGTRAVHYIAVPRAFKFDMATGDLVVRMSDEGLQPIPGLALMEPQFRTIDPNSAAELVIDLPETLVRLSDTSTDGDLRFDEFVVADANSISVEIAWSDDVFYEDPRATESSVLPTEKWEKGKLSIAIPGKEGAGNQTM